MGCSFDLLEQFRLGPAKLTNRLDIPTPLLHCQFRLQDDHILSPANQQGRIQSIRVTSISTVKVSHSAQIPRRKAHLILIIGR